MTTQEIRSTDVSGLSDFVLSLEIVRARILVEDQGQKGMQRRLDELVAEKRRREEES